MCIRDRCNVVLFDGFGYRDLDRSQNPVANTANTCPISCSQDVYKRQDESDGSFLKAKGDISVVTNVDKDHLDYWGSFE